MTNRSTPASVAAVNVGQPQTYPWLGRELETSIFKQPVAGPVQVFETHLEGDRQSDLEHHGGADKAVYAYSIDDALSWAEQLGRPTSPLEPALLGENLTVRGVDLIQCVIGERWRVGTAVLQVSEPRTPCWKLGLRIGDPKFPRQFAAAGKTGVLLRVLQQGHLQAGDSITVVDAPDHGVTIEMINDVYYGRNKDLSPMFEATELAAHWRTWAEHRTVWHLNDESEKGINVVE